MWSICAGGLPDSAPKDSGQVVQAGAPAFGGECRISKECGTTHYFNILILRFDIYFPKTSISRIE
jgi:hypothetical protein